MALQDPGGHTITASAMATAAHHPLVIDFFTAGCADCQRLGPELCAVSQRFSGVEFVAVDAAGEDARTVAAFGAHYLPRACAVTLLVDPALRTAHDYEVTVVPTVYVVDRNGRIASGAFGQAGLDDLATTLQRLG